jgi:hypothetical protein
MRQTPDRVGRGLQLARDTAQSNGQLRVNLPTGSALPRVQVRVVHTRGGGRGCLGLLLLLPAPTSRFTRAMHELAEAKGKQACHDLA